jgi:aspartate kinase
LEKFIVAKFGGSSVRDASAMFRCAQIVKDNPEIKIVILSATYNTTNNLEAFAEKSIKGHGLKVFEKIKDQHLEIAEKLSLTDRASELLFNLFELLLDLGEQIKSEGEVAADIMDEVYSIGERMSTVIFSDLLGKERSVALVDARELIKTDGNFKCANPIIEEIQKNCDEVLPLLFKDNELVVTQGFIGETLDRRTTTLGREGSDYSAALLAEAVEAKLLQIWTDVDGIYSNDPKVDSDALRFDKISYDEAERMAKGGAKVLFPETIAPARRKNIPVFVGSSIHPENGGTTIS